MTVHKRPSYTVLVIIQKQSNSHVIDALEMLRKNHFRLLSGLHTTTFALGSKYSCHCYENHSFSKRSFKIGPIGQVNSAHSYASLLSKHFKWILNSKNPGFETCHVKTLSAILVTPNNVKN